MVDYGLVLLLRSIIGYIRLHRISLSLVSSNPVIIFLIYSSGICGIISTNCPKFSASSF